MRILWLCPLVEHPRPNFWCPAVVRLHEAPTGPFPTIWTTTNALINHPWACGVAEVTDEQLVALSQEPGVQLFDEATERTQQFRMLPRPRRDALTGMLQQMGLPAPTQTERLAALFDRIIVSNEPTKTLDSLLQELTQRLERP